MALRSLRSGVCHALLVAIATSLVAAAAGSTEAAPNRLIDTGSPYLLQHAHNPVNWYPWGPEAIEKARREDKPIFVSVGYSTCYWCHVANRTLYSNPAIAALMNRWFVNVKVDREQRPDLDAVYMLATMLLTGRGGWPNNVFLTPELKPFFAGSYFPPEDDDFGRPGFVTVLKTVHRDWTERREAVDQTAEKAVQAMRRVQRRNAPAAGRVAPDAWLKVARDNLRADFDAKHGGFREGRGNSAKFPHETFLALLIVDYRVSRDRDALGMLTATLDAMALGGIHDHLGGGFHRYSIESSWSVPHFEKMLYDNAQLLRIYAEAWQLTRKPLYRQVALGIGDYVLRQLAAPEGGFYTAEDAEVGHEEGASYLWTPEEIAAALGEAPARAFFTTYQITPLAAQREADALEGGSRGALRMRVSKAPDAIPESLASARAKLFALREKRIQPARDEKLIVSLNGLAIDAFAVSGKILGKPAYVAAARRAAQRVWVLAYDARGRVLHHEAYRGEARGDGFLDDYALLGLGFLSLADATGEVIWRRRAVRLADDALYGFARSDASFAMTKAEKDLVIQPEDAGDIIYPSGTSAMAGLLLRLSLEPGATEYRRAAELAVARIAGAVNAQPDQWPTLVAATAKIRPGESTAGASAKPTSFALLDTASHVKATAALRRRGVHEEIVVTLNIASGFHVNANPASLDYLIPTALSFEDLVPSRIHYPAAKLFKPVFARDGLMVYDGTVEVVADVPAGTSAKSIRGKVRAQACDDQVCLPPADLPITLRAQ